MKYEIAFQGEHYSYSEIAAKKFLGEAAICHPTPSFAEVFRAVTTEKVALGIIPIENTLYGSIHRNFDLLLENEVIIVGEVNLRIELHLIALPNVSLDQVKTVYSHPAALEQCRKFFRNHPNIEGVSTYDTAGSVKIIKEKKQSSLAAIASRWAAKDYGMAILCQEIEDFQENFTRFLIVSKRKYDFGPPTKTSIVFSISDIPGALFKSLSVFFLRDINLVKIESRPLKGKPWEYLFYLDFKGAVDEKRCANALRHLEEIADFIKIFGSYPSANKNPND